MTGKAGQALAGSVAFNLGQWALVIVLSRWAGLHVMGEFAWALAVCTPVFMLTNLGMRTVALTDPEMGAAFRKYAGLRVALAAVGLVVVVCTAAVLGHLSLVVFLVALAKAIDAMGEIFYAWFQHRGRFGPVALTQVINGVFTPLVVAAFLAVGASGPFAMLGSVFASGLAQVALLVEARRTGLPVSSAAFWRRPSGGEWARMIGIALPAGLASAVTSLLANVPRYAIEDELGSDALAVFSAISYVQIAGLTVVGAVATVLLPRLVRIHQEHGAVAVLRTALSWSLVPLVLTPAAAAAAWLAGAPVLRLLYGDEVFVNVPVLIALVVALGLAAVGWMFDLGLAARRMFRGQLYTTLITLVVAVPMTWWLTREYGLVGGAVAAAATTLLQAVLRVGLLTRGQRPAEMLRGPAETL